MGKNSRISKNFSTEIDKVLNGTYKKHNQVKAKDYTPLILVRCGVKNLPMLITAKHILSTILTEEEAKMKKNYEKNINYHGLGKNLLIKVIANLDNPLSVYRKNNNNYIIITKEKDKYGNYIIVPIEINSKGTYNNIYINENQIKSVYGKRNLIKYLKNKNFEKIHTKKGTALNERVRYPNIGNSVKKNISQKNREVKLKN